MQADRELLLSVKSAVRLTVAAVRDLHPQQTLAGYALLTDDNLVTLTYMAVTQDLLETGNGDDLLFSPTDWPYEYDSASFTTANQRLRAMAAASEMERHVQLAFGTLVEGLYELQAEGLFSPQVFLSVLSTDPGPNLVALENASVERLNPKDVVEARNRFMERWAG